MFPSFFYARPAEICLMQIEHGAATDVLYLLAVRRTWIPVTDSRKGYHATLVCDSSSGSPVWRATERFPTWRNCESRASKVYIGVYRERDVLKEFHRCSRRMAWLLSFSRLERIVVSRFTASKNFSLARGMCFSGRPRVVKTFLTISESYILSRVFLESV